MTMRRWASPQCGLATNGEGESSFSYHDERSGDGEGAGYFWGNRLGNGYLSVSDWGGDHRSSTWDADPIHRWLGGGEA